MYEYENIDLLVGKTLSHIEATGAEIRFYCSDGNNYMLYHAQDCCESVTIEEIIGDLDDLIGTPITLASEDVNRGNSGCETWTFYNIATKKGHVTIRWYGESNGYYSESVDFSKF